MNKDSIESILNICMLRYPDELDPPSESDWDIFRNEFKTDFGTSFVNFIELMAVYKFPGEIYNISSGKINLSDSIYEVYAAEKTEEYWVNGMLPFYDIGNGDCFCLNFTEGERSKVYYFDHESEKFRVEYKCFDDWLNGLPDFIDKE